MKLNMDKNLLKIKSVVLAVFVSGTFFAQSSGNLSFTYTPTSHQGYSGTKNVLAIWVEDGSGNFVKTRMKRAGWGTADHLPTWAVNAGGSANNCMTGCNVTGASTGATLSSFTTKSISWDGTDASGNLVADGTYKIIIESCWNHGSSGKATRTFTFTKGSSTDSQTPSNDANFTNISLTWTPSGATGIDNVDQKETALNIYPNPSLDGTFKVDYNKSNSVKVVNVIGETVYNENEASESGIKSIDLSAQPNGIYFFYISDGKNIIKKKVILNK